MSHAAPTGHIGMPVDALAQAALTALADQGLVFRAITESDLATVCQIESQAHAHPWELLHFQDCINAGYELLALTRHGQLLGYYVAMPSLDELHLLNLTVSPAHQRQGYARLLMHALMAKTIATGALSIWLEVRHSNHAAKALYAALGFTTVRLRKDYYPAQDGRREDAWVMRWDARAGVEALA
jgi:ribosomal-protein-alanine N-acetyltransferase